MTKHRFKRKRFFVEGGSTVNLSKIDNGSGSELADEDNAREAMASDLTYLQKQQEKLYAEDKKSLIVIFQGMDAAGKDSCIRHVFSGVNPQGCAVQSFKAPSSEELNHHYLWRPMRALPARGKIAIFNRSYYEEVVVVRVHPNFLEPQRTPELKNPEQIWKYRFEEIRQFEKMLVEHGTHIIKFFLHVSQKTQLERLVDRLEEPDKHWKVNINDFEERKLWDKYQEAYEAMLPATSTEQTPWYIVPSDSKWYARAVVADLLAQHLEAMDVNYPVTPAETSQQYLQLAAEYRLNEMDVEPKKKSNKKKNSES